MKKHVSLVIKLVTLSMVALLYGCNTEPDWQALYSEKLGQQVVELDDAYLDREFTDPMESGSLTRAAWAKFEGGEIILLGLPPHGLEPREVVEQTVVLRPEAWRDACGDALGEADVEGWRMPHAHRGNAIRIYVGDRHDAYCQFYFLPEGWELRTVQSYGVIKPRTVASLDQ